MNTLLKCIVGSTAHGLNTPESDIDTMSIVVEDRESITGLDNWEGNTERNRPEGTRSVAGETEGVVYGLKKWMRLAVKGNPTILLPLFVQRTHVIDQSEYGKELRTARIRKAIVSKQAGSACLGFMKDQKERLLGERGQKRTNRPELIEKFGYDVDYARHALLVGFQGIELMETGRIKFPMKENIREFLLSVRQGKQTLALVKAQLNALDMDLKHARDNSKLKDEADLKTINEFMHYVYLDDWNVHEGCYNNHY